MATESPFATSTVNLGRPGEMPAFQQMALQGRMPGSRLGLGATPKRVALPLLFLLPLSSPG